MKKSYECELAIHLGPVLVSQAVEGTQGTTFYITALRTGLDGFDKIGEFLVAMVITPLFLHHPNLQSESRSNNPSA
jgi:hypothetical protein